MCVMKARCEDLTNEMAESSSSMKEGRAITVFKAYTGPCASWSTCTESSEQSSPGKIQLHFLEELQHAEESLQPDVQSGVQG